MQNSVPQTKELAQQAIDHGHLPTRERLVLVLMALRSIDGVYTQDLADLAWISGLGQRQVQNTIGELYRRKLIRAVGGKSTPTNPHGLAYEFRLGESGS